MNQANNRTLPCLQTVGPWWSENDRRILFCHLTNMFDFQEGYLSSLPAAEYLSDGELHHLTTIDIQNEYHVFFKNNMNKKSTCCKIRNLKFSFGKINPVICHLCPFNNLYRNYNQTHEYRLIYYFLKNKNLDLGSYIAASNTETNNLFDSYFPAYVDNVLVNAFPFSLIVTKMIELGINNYLLDPSSFIDALGSKCQPEILRLIRYIRNKDQYQVNGKIYTDEILKAPILTFEKLLDSNLSTRFEVSDLMIRRLFNIIKDRKNYIVKPKSEYYLYLNASSETSLFQTTIDSYTPVPATSTDRNSLINNEFKHLEDPNVLSGPVLDPVITDPPYLATTQTPTTTLPLSIASSYKKNTRKTTTPYEPKKCSTNYKIEDFYSFKSFYSLLLSNDIYHYGSGSAKNDAAIFKAFFQDASYLSMEPLLYEGNEGILISNPDKEFMFYSIEHYGPKPLRMIADTKIIVYTSNVYYLCKYLFKNKIFNFSVKDIGAVVSIKDKTHVKGIIDITSEIFPKCMTLYKDIYENAFNMLSNNLTCDLLRFESFYPLICSDGGNPPFEELKDFISFDDSLSIKYLYDSSKMPLLPGTFIQFRINNHCKEISIDLLYKKFIDSCIDFNRYYPFTNGTIFILKVEHDNILFFLTGSLLEKQKIELYLNASIRRIFSLTKFDSNHLLIKESSINHDPKTSKEQKQ